MAECRVDLILIIFPSKESNHLRVGEAQQRGSEGLWCFLRPTAGGSIALDEKLNVGPQVGRGLLQHWAPISLSHHHSTKGPDGSRCSLACSPSFHFTIFHAHSYDSTQDATKSSHIFILYKHYICMGSPLKDKTTCWQLSVVIKMDFCVEVRTNSIRDGADRLAPGCCSRRGPG